MSTPSSGRQVLNQLRTMIKRERSQPKPAPNHTPRPLQQQGSGGKGTGLKLNRRRVTLSRSAQRWSRGIVWSLVGLTGFSVIYGMVARIETSIEATGKLVPKQGVTKVSAPFAAIVNEVLVKDGEQVKANQPLVKLRDESAVQTMNSLKNNKKQIERDLTITRKRLGLPLLINREMDADSQREARIAEKEAELRHKILLFEHAKAKATERGEKAVLADLKDRAAISAKTLERLMMLQKQGAVSGLQVDQEKQRLLDTRMQLHKQQMLVEQAPAHAAASALRSEHVMVQEQSTLYRRLGELKHDLSDIDTQLANQRKREKLLTVNAPRKGMIFDLKVGKGELATPNSPLMEVVPSDGLRARVMIPNKDVGFVHEGMPAEVRIASYPFTEYGSIKGKLIRIGADSKSTNPNVPAEHFPAIIQIDAASLNKNGEALPLKSGMSVTTLIKLGSRPAISLLSDKILNLFDGVQTIR